MKMKTKITSYSIRETQANCENHKKRRIDKYIKL